MNDAVRLKKIERAACRLIDAIMQDPGGFSLATLHCMTKLGGLAGHADHVPVTACEGGWSMESKADEPRFWGAGALADVESN